MIKQNDARNIAMGVMLQNSREARLLQEEIDKAIRYSANLGKFEFKLSGIELNHKKRDNNVNAVVYDLENNYGYTCNIVDYPTDDTYILYVSW